MYLNPTAAQTLNLRIAADAGEVTLTDMTGRVCRRQTVARSTQLGLQGLVRSVYTLTVSTPTGQVRQKIVKE